MTHHTTCRGRAPRTAPLAAALGAALVAALATLPAGAAPTGRAAPTCTPRSAPSVVGVDGTTATTTVPTCTSPSGVTAYRIQALDRAGTAVLRSVDVASAYTQATVTGIAPGTAVRYRALALNSDGAGPASATSALTVQPFTTLGAFTDRQYRDLAGRAPSSTELASWATRIGDGSVTPIGAIESLAQGSYLQQQSPVIRLYRAYFLRLPDAAGLAYWVGQSRAGVSLPRISQSFSTSPEFRTLYGSLSDRAFVAQIYLNILGRPGSTADLDYWTAEITSGRRTRGAVMVGFSESPEYRTRTQGIVDVVNLFTGLIRRVPTSAEVTTWSVRTRAQTITFLLASSAYASRTKVVAPAAPGPLTGLTAIDGGGNGTICGVGTGGQVLCWGKYDFPTSVGTQAWTRARAVPGATGAVDVAVGTRHICALLGTGRVRCWGSNFYGQLGDGTTADRAAPGVDPGLSGVVALSAGLEHTCAVLATGGVRCWGRNFPGALGDGTTTDRSTPVAVSGLTDAVDVSAGQRATCAVRAGGEVRCWGRTDRFTASPTESAVPIAVAGLGGASRIETSASSCAVVTGGAVRCFGDDSRLRGDGGTAGRYEVSDVAGVSGATSLSVVLEHACATTSGGGVRCWGRNFDGELGDGSTYRSADVPVAVVGLDGSAVDLASGSVHTCALLSTGQARCWGYNYTYGLGDGSTSVRALSPVPVTVEP